MIKPTLLYVRGILQHTSLTLTDSDNSSINVPQTDSQSNCSGGPIQVLKGVTGDGITSGNMNNVVIVS